MLEQDKKIDFLLYFLRKLYLVEIIKLINNKEKLITINEI
jgi:hypothetical protein